jgi:glyoxylase-like metal-dependent hydrolase (beta-lactamase superfamily II)
VPDRVVELAADVFLGRGTDVNFVLVRDGDAVTLIDTGYPGDRAKLLEALAAIGRRPEDVVAVLITHAHVDHIGSVNHLHDTYGVPVHTGAREAAHARREFVEQAGRLDVARNLWRPGVAPWLARVLRVGVTEEVTVPSAETFPAGAPADLPGHPVPVATPGHTSGHTAYHLPDAGAVVTGDALVTGHAVLRHRGPSVLPPFFNHRDPVPALAAIAELDAGLLLPGHGDPLHRPIADAVAEARERAGR